MARSKNEEITVYFEDIRDFRDENSSNKATLVFDVNTTIEVVKSLLCTNEFPNHNPDTWSFMFDRLLLENEATLVGLGIVNEDTIYMSFNGDEEFHDAPDQLKMRIAKEISVGLNVLLGETEHGFDVLYKDKESKTEPMSLPECCKSNMLVFLSTTLQTLRDDLLNAKVYEIIPHGMMIKMPDFSSVVNHLSNNEYATLDEVINDFDDIYDPFLNSLPLSLFDDGIFCMSEIVMKENYVCSCIDCPLKNIVTDVFYVGPARNATLSNYMAYPPTVQLKGRKVTEKTTLGDLFYSYKKYSERENLHINRFNYGSDCLDCFFDEKVFDVIQINKMSKHYFSFPFDITKHEDERRIDDLVEFIEGEGAVTSKKKRKKKRKSNQPQALVSTDNTKSEAGNIMVKYSEIKSETEVVEDISRHEIFGAISKNVQTELDAKHSKLNNLCTGKLELERAIDEEREHFATHKQNVEDIINTKSAEMKNLILMIEKSEDVKSGRLKEVDKVDIELSDVETQMKELQMKKKELQMKKTELLKENNFDDERIHKIENKRHKLEGYIEKELRKAKEAGNKIEEKIQDLEKELSDIKMTITNLPYETLTNHRAQPAVEPNKQLLEFIDNQISEKEQELECPVCLEVAGAPIFMCSELHLICCNCRPKVKACPECRMPYEGKPKRHRYAEKTAEELIRIRSQRAQVVTTST